MHEAIELGKKRGDLSSLKPFPRLPSSPIPLPLLSPCVLRLLIVGHAVIVPLDIVVACELSTTDKDPETAWIAVLRPGATVNVTDAHG
ncbi:MAG TPA: hypothetical protein VNO30_16990 [Kofleriaceae bacterium]|nr:hypothetical protein [Kofleriaceae bacterium]